MKNIFSLIIFALVLESCAVKNVHTVGTPLNNQRVLVELELDDILFLGETEISYKYSRYLGFITRMIELNGEHPNNANKHYVTLPVSQNFWSFFDRQLSRALYKAYIEFPEADYFEIKNTNHQRHRMFLGSKIKKTVTLKAYKYRY